MTKVVGVNGPDTPGETGHAGHFTHLHGRDRPVTCTAICSKHRIGKTAHRLRLRPDLWVRGATPDDVVAECLDEVPTPPAEETGSP